MRNISLILIIFLLGCNSYSIKDDIQERGCKVKNAIRYETTFYAGAHNPGNYTEITYVCEDSETLVRKVSGHISLDDALEMEEKERDRTPDKSDGFGCIDVCIEVIENSPSPCPGFEYEYHCKDHLYIECYTKQCRCNYIDGVLHCDGVSYKERNK